MPPESPGCVQLNQIGTGQPAGGMLQILSHQQYVNVFLTLLTFCQIRLSYRTQSDLTGATNLYLTSKFAHPIYHSFKLNAAYSCESEPSGLMSSGGTGLEDAITDSAEKFTSGSCICTARHPSSDRLDACTGNCEVTIANEWLDKVPERTEDELEVLRDVEKRVSKK